MKKTRTCLWAVQDVTAGRAEAGRRGAQQGGPPGSGPGRLQTGWAETAAAAAGERGDWCASHPAGVQTSAFFFSFK